MQQLIARGEDRGVLLPGRRDPAPAAGDRRGSARPVHAQRARHVRRSAAGRRPLQRAQPGHARRAWCTIDGREVLRYKPFPVDVAIVRGTYADTRGNVSPEEEAIDMDIHSMALAAHNSGGRVLVQVREVVEAGRLHPRHVRIPGIMVDAVVDGAAISSSSTVSATTRPVSGARRADAAAGAAPTCPARARAPHHRAASGDGAPARGVAELRVRHSRRHLRRRSPSRASATAAVDERRAGRPQRRGCSTTRCSARRATPTRSCRRSSSSTTTAAGASTSRSSAWARPMREGNVNVSHLGGTLIGPGGFIEIAQNAKKVVFCGTFDAQGSRLEWADGAAARSSQPGRVQKFVRRVERITFSGAFARAQRPGGAVRHRARRLRAGRDRARAARGRAGHRRRPRHPPVHGIRAAGDGRAADADASFR